MLHKESKITNHVLWRREDADLIYEMSSGGGEHSLEEDVS